MQLFEKPADYEAFGQVMREALDESSMQICACTAMPNHWHLLLWPECDGELATFVQRLTITHVRRWQQHWGYAGLGHVYQGRYKSFPVENDEHFRVVARYVERNAQRANLVLRAEEGNCETISPGIGLSAERSPTKNRPQSRCRPSVRSLG